MKTLIVCGHGSGISHAVAQRFGRAGHPVALVARNAERLDAAAKALVSEGVNARAFVCDLGDTAAVTRMVADVRTALGPIGIVHWNAYAGGAGDLATGSLDELRTVLDVSVFGLIAATQAALPDLKANAGSLLITGGGLGTHDAAVDKMATDWGAMGLAVGKSAQHKVAGLLSQRLGRDDVYVGEVVVLGMVKGTVFDSGNATLEASAIAEKFWALNSERKDASVSIR